MSASTRTEKLDLRLTSQAKQRIVAAAELDHRTVSDFVLRSALARADEVLAEQTSLRMSAEQWAKFHAALDAPPRDLPELRKLMNTPSIFEKPKSPS
jgi:uncharacterized protein (DUF1778 family)